MSSVRMYHEELSKRLNASLAMYVVNAEVLISDGVLNRDALSELANRARYPSRDDGGG